MSELPAKVWKNIAETRQARIVELKTALRALCPEHEEENFSPACPVCLAIENYYKALQVYRATQQPKHDEPKHTTGRAGVDFLHQVASGEAELPDGVSFQGAGGGDDR